MPSSLFDVIARTGFANALKLQQSKRLQTTFAFGIRIKTRSFHAS